MFEPSKSGFGFSKKFWFVQVESFSGGYFQNCVGFKIGSGFVSKSFASNLLRFPKSASRFSVKVLASKRFHLAKSVFVAKVIFCKVRFSNLASRFLAKVSAVWFGLFSQVRFF